MNDALGARAGGHCELCGGDGELTGLAVPPRTEATIEDGVALCAICLPQLAADAVLDANHWYCLQGTIWSELPPVQVVSWRLLHRLPDEAWARELLEQVWLDDEVRAWAEAGRADATADTAVIVVDANGTPLVSGDAVLITRSLDVKGTSFVAKRGTVMRNIRVSDDPTHIEGKVNGTPIFVKTCFVKKTG